jgi:hypothetical protein
MLSVFQDFALHRLLPKISRGGALFPRKLPALLLPIGTAAILSITAHGPVSANQPTVPPSRTTAAAPALDAIAQNTPGYSEAFPAGVPKTYAWCNGSYKPSENSVPPSDFTAVTALGSVYPKFGEPPYSNPGAKVIISNAVTYVHLRATNEWVLVQDQSEDEIAGAHFDANASRNTITEMKIEVQPDGVAVIDSPPAGRNDVLWIVKRGAYQAGSVDAVYVHMDMKTTDHNMKLVANVGADWWRDPEAEHVKNFVNQRGVGNSNWVELSTDWTTLVFFSGSTSQLEANPPPPLSETALATKPSRARRAANTASPCLRVLAPR